MARTYALRRRVRSHDFDIVNDDDNVRGQVIKSPAGYTLYLIGGVQSHLPPFPTPMEALEAFEEWAKENTTATLPIIRKRDD